jgi:hypothetical protein
MWLSTTQVSNTSNFLPSVDRFRFEFCTMRLSYIRVDTFKKLSCRRPSVHKQHFRIRFVTGQPKLLHPIVIEDVDPIVGSRYE